MQTTAEVRRPDAATSGMDSNVHASSSAEPFAKPDLRAKRHGKPKKPSYFRSQKPRRDEVIGGGFFVFRRGDARLIAAAPCMKDHGLFLLDRLEEFERELLDDEVAREFMGHVAPAIARFRAAIAKAEAAHD